jgi:hypothetical protein
VGSRPLGSTTLDFPAAAAQLHSFTADVRGGAGVGDDGCWQLGAAERMGFELATSRGPKYGEAEREHGRLAVEDQAYTQTLWEALQETLVDIQVSQQLPLRLCSAAPAAVWQSMIARGRSNDAANRLHAGFSSRPVPSLVVQRLTTLLADGRWMGDGRAA